MKITKTNKEKVLRTAIRRNFKKMDGNELMTFILLMREFFKTDILGSTSITKERTTKSKQYTRGKKGRTKKINKSH